MSGYAPTALEGGILVCVYIHSQEKSTMCVGTFSGVTSPGIVISSARGGTERGNSSPTRASIMDVFPHCASRGRGGEER